MRIIAGAYGGRLLKTVEGPGYRPAMSRVRESLFSMLSSRGVVWAGSRVLDLFAGSGSLAFEALSRGADEAWFVELNAKAAACIEKNATSLGIEPQRWRVLAEDITKVLGRRAAAPFDVVFIDPPLWRGAARADHQTHDAQPLAGPGRGRRRRGGGGAGVRRRNRPRRS